MFMVKIKSELAIWQQLLVFLKININLKPLTVVKPGTHQEDLHVR